MRRAAGALIGSGLAVVVVHTLAACGNRASAEPRARTITLHAPAQCAPATSPFVVYQPLGDFPLESEVALSLSAATAGMVISGMSSATEELVASVTDATSAQWAAHALVPSSGSFDLLALPAGSPCMLTDPISPRTSAAFGAIDEGHLLVAGGAATSGVPQTILVDLTRGVASALPLGLLVPRTNPSVTSFSGGAVVAGGVEASDGATFEIYSSSVGDFDGTTHPLSGARARHGAVVMASGETLLVGGVDASGGVLGTMEIIDPLAERSQTAGLAFLSVPRADPVVLRLVSGEILVAGGVDGSGAPVSTLEWFSSDASTLERLRTLVSSSHEAFVPLAAGGALAVIAPDTPSAGFQNTWVISAAGALQAAAPIDGALTDARFIEGTGQAPALWTGDRWLVWNPWSGSFGALASAIGASGPTGDATVSPEPGLGAWIDGSSLFALRFGVTRGPYATEAASAPLLVEDTSLTAPDQLVTSEGAATFDPKTGLTLASGASVFLTDATFGSFALDAETPGALPPAIVLRDDAGNETVLDASTCPFSSGSTLHVERDAGTMRASSGAALVTCSVAPAAGARVSIGVRGIGTGSSVVRSITVTRS